MDAGRYAAVIVASTLLDASLDLEYLKAALALGTPSAVVIPSGDNLTTKGMLQLGVRAEVPVQPRGVRLLHVDPEEVWWRHEEFRGGPRPAHANV